MRRHMEGCGQWVRARYDEGDGLGFDSWDEGEGGTGEVDAVAFFFLRCIASRFANCNSSSCPGVSFTVPLPPACCFFNKAMRPAASGCAAKAERAASGSSLLSAALPGPAEEEAVLGGILGTEGDAVRASGAVEDDDVTLGADCDDMELDAVSLGNVTGMRGTVGASSR